MRRRIQGLCLLLLGAVLGWVGGGEIARMARTSIELWPAFAVALTLLAGLAAVFVGVVLVAGIPLFQRAEEPENNPPSSSRSE
jgi:hypothetical protein